MSNNGLGDTTTPDNRTTTVEATEDIDAGDIVAIKQDEDDARLPPAAKAQDDTSPNVDQVAGVAMEDIDNEEYGTILLSGGVIANVAADVSAGERLDVSAVAGQADTADGGPLLALSDEGGTDRAGTALADNEAEVYL